MKHLGIPFMISALLITNSICIPAYARENSETITTVETTTAETRTVPGYYGVTADVLNVRSGPGTGYSIIGKLYQGEAVLVTSISNGWAKFGYKTTIGYAKADYLKEYKG